MLWQKDAQRKQEDITGEERRVEANGAEKEERKGKNCRRIQKMRQEKEAKSRRS